MLADDLIYCRKMVGVTSRCSSVVAQCEEVSRDTGRSRVCVPVLKKMMMLSRIGGGWWGVGGSTLKRSALSVAWSALSKF